MIVAGWEEAFVATMVALGGHPEDAGRMLVGDSAARAATLLRALSDPAAPRGARARALAAPLTALAVDLEKSRLG